jgi:hypothetical protein
MIYIIGGTIDASVMDLKILKFIKKYHTLAVSLE